MKIFKGCHYGCPFPFPWFYFNKKNLSKTLTVVFDESIRYDIGKEDQMDVNKFFGFSYGWHQTDSDRIGFRYNIERDEVELVLYSYEKGTRIKTQSILFVKLNEPVKVSIDISINEYGRYVTAQVIQNTNMNIIKKTYSFKTSKWGYTLGLYFGGNQRAPHTITIHKCKE